MSSSPAGEPGRQTAQTVQSQSGFTYARPKPRPKRVRRPGRAGPQAAWRVERRRLGTRKVGWGHVFPISTSAPAHTATSPFHHPDGCICLSSSWSSPSGPAVASPTRMVPLGLSWGWGHCQSRNRPCAPTARLPRQPPQTGTPPPSSPAPPIAE